MKIHFNVNDIMASLHRSYVERIRIERVAVCCVGMTLRCVALRQIPHKNVNKQMCAVFRMRMQKSNLRIRPK